MNRSRFCIPALVLLGCVAMALVEAVIQPGYLIKSLVKLLLFGGTVGLWAVGSRTDLRPLFARTDLRRAVLLGAGVFGLLLGGFFLLRPFIDLDAIADRLLAKEQVDAGNFLFVALYISLCNSLLEELFFRGFAYLSLRSAWPDRTASVFSAAAFSLYHVCILTGWFAPWMFALMLAGLFAAGLLFNRLDRRGSLLPSWLVHAGANLAINTVGLMMFGLL